MMDYRSLGQTGITVSALGFGCGNVGGLMTGDNAAAQRACVARALDAGITYFDTASIYGAGRSEENLGRVLRELDAWNRVSVGTKVRLSAMDLSDPAPAIRRSLVASLERLARESVDLLQLHNHIVSTSEGQPGRAAVPLSTLDAVRDGLRAVVQEGLVRHAGFTALGERAAVIQAAQSGGLETAQCYLNALNPSAVVSGASGGAQDFGGVVPAAARAGLGVLAIRVMAAGALAGMPERRAPGNGRGAPLVAGGDYPTDMERAARLQPLVAEFGLEGLPELALRFVLAQPGVSSALLGYSDQEQLEDALRWAARGPLPDAAVQRVVDMAR